MRKLVCTVALLALAACGGDNVTGPSTRPSTIDRQAPAPEVVKSQPVNVPAGEADPTVELSYVELNTDGSGRFCRSEGGEGGDRAYLTYTIPGRVDAAAIYGHYETGRVEQGQCVSIPPANQVVAFRWCGTQKVQVDVNQLGFLAGRHLGHVFANVEGTLENCTLTPTVDPTPAPSPTPTPEPSPTPSPEPTPSPTPSPEPTPSPTPSPEPTPSPTPTPEPSPTPTPEPERGLCYYNVSGKSGQEKCFAQPGYVSWNPENHLCALTFPGVAQKGFNLNPGQSDPDCLRKQDEE